MNSGSFLSKIRQIFLLTQMQLLVSFVIALAVFLIEYGTVIVQFFENGAEIGRGNTAGTVSQHILSFLHQISGLPYAGKITAGLLFAMAGAAVYFAYIALSNVLVSIRNEVVVDIEYSKGHAVRVLITRFGEKILAVCAFILLCAASIFLFLPYWMDMLGIFVYSGLQSHSIIYLLIGYIGLALNIYIVWVAAYFTWIYEETV